MTPIPAADLRELSGASLSDPDFPRGASAPPGPEVVHVRSRYRLFDRVLETGSWWTCSCGRDACRADPRSWADLSAAYALWAVPPELPDRLVPVLRWTGGHFGTAPSVKATAPATVSNYSDLSAAQRSVLLAGQPHERRCVSLRTAEALVRRGLLVADPVDPNLLLFDCWHRLSEAGLRARRMLEAGEVPDPPGISAARRPRTWGAGSPDPGEEGLEVVDCDGDVWRRSGGRWYLVEWVSGQPMYVGDDGTTWSGVLDYAPLTERLRRDPKRARPADCLQAPMATLLETVQWFLNGTGSLSDLRRARLAAARALGDSRRATRWVVK